MISKIDVIHKMVEKFGTSDWPSVVDAVVPDGCMPCILCGEMCMKAEAIEKDWFGRGRVIRIFSMCDESLNQPKDFTRTEFDMFERAVVEWNNMQIPKHF